MTQQQQEVLDKLEAVRGQWVIYERYGPAGSGIFEIFKPLSLDVFCLEHGIEMDDIDIDTEQVKLRLPVE